MAGGRVIDTSRTQEDRYKTTAAGVSKRIVRTPEGAKFYGKPVGAVITQGEEVEAEARGRALKIQQPPNAIQEYKAEESQITVTATHRKPGSDAPIVSTFKVATENQAKALRAALEAAGATVETSTGTVEE